MLSLVAAALASACASGEGGDTDLDDGLLDEERGDALNNMRWPTLRKGDSDSNVIALQHLLNDHDQSLDVTGSFDDATDTAVRAFQSSRGLAVDGIVGKNTWGAVIVTVHPRQYGDATRAFQDLLAQKYEYDVEVSGDHDAESQEHVRKFQGDMCLRWVDAIVGPETWYTLLTDSSQCTGGESGGDAAQVAARILAAQDRGDVFLLMIQVSGVLDGADAYSNIKDVSNGLPARRSSYENAPGGSVALSISMLDAIDDYANNQKKSFQINSLAGGSHSKNSAHYQGRAVDFQVQGNASALERMCVDGGATLVLGPGDPGHSTHVHCQW